MRNKGKKQEAMAIRQGFSFLPETRKFSIGGGDRNTTGAH
jgi:hypothetical protein